MSGDSRGLGSTVLVVFWAAFGVLVVSFVLLGLSWSCLGVLLAFTRGTFGSLGFLDPLLPGLEFIVGYHIFFWCSLGVHLVLSGILWSSWGSLGVVLRSSGRLLDVVLGLPGVMVGSSDDLTSLLVFSWTEVRYEAIAHLVSSEAEHAHCM